MTYIGPYTHSVARTDLSKMRDIVSIRDWDDLAGTDPTYDCTASINTALQDLISGAGGGAARAGLYFPPGPGYLISQSGSDARGGYGILNSGVSMFSTGRLDAPFIAATSMPSTCDLMRIQASSVTGGYIDFLRLERLQFTMTNGSGIRGRRSVFLDLNVETHADFIEVNDCYFSACNGVPALESTIDYTVNPNGAVLGMQVVNSLFLSGVALRGIADSLQVRDVIIRDVNAVCGLVVSMAHNAEGSAAGLGLYGLNIAAAGGALQVRSGRGVVIENADLEQAAGTVTSVVDLNGADAKLVDVTIKNMTVGVFGTASVTNVLSATNTNNLSVDDYAFIHESTHVAVGFNIASNVNHFAIGKGEMSPNIPTPISSAGADGRGVTQTLTVGSGFAQIPGEEVFGYQRDNDSGQVTLYGALSSSGASSGTLGTLPANLRPARTARRTVYAADSSGALIHAIVFVDAGTGNLDFGSSGFATTISLDGVSFPTTPWDLGNA